MTLSPPEVVVLEGGTATFTCFPYAPPEQLILIDQDSVIVKDPRLTFNDFIGETFPLSNRTYTLIDVKREDNGKQFRCVLGSAVSTETLLTVYGKKRCRQATPLCTAKSENKL